MSISNEELLGLVGDDEGAVVEETTTNEAELDNESDDNPVAVDDGSDHDVDDEDDQQEDDEEEDDGSEEDGEDEEEGESDSDQTYTVKVNGEEIEVSQDELIRGYSTNKAAQEKFREADAMRKQAEKFVEMLQEDPAYVLEQMGMDVRSLAEHYLAERLQYESLSDEERELIEAKQKLARYEAQQKAQQEEQYQRELSEKVEAARGEYVTRINTALDTAGLPQTDWTVQRMAKYMHEALSSDDPAIQKLSDSDIVELVAEDYAEELSKMPAETLERLLGKEAANTLRKNDLSKLKGNKKQPQRSKKPVKGKGQKRDKQYMTSDDWNAYLDSITD